MTNTKGKLNTSFILLKESYKELSKNDPLRMAGATAFFTSFALPPILIILIQALGLLFNPRRISHQLFQDLSEIIGKESMFQIIQTLIGFRRLAQNWFIAVVGFLFMIFVASTLFFIIKNSINQLWKIRLNKPLNFYQKLKKRLQSIYLILIAGILFITGVALDGIQQYLAESVFSLSASNIIIFNKIADYLFSLVAVTIWFAILFRYLPDGRPAWKVALFGGAITSLFFNIGKLILHVLLNYQNIDAIYRASASVVLLLLFVFYSSLILYFGATLTKLFAEKKHLNIKPLSNASHYKLTHI
jgi:Predicted membrane protein